ncbi:uncharacterized protein LOC110203774 [Phascolarctos cinereus]
MERAHYDAKEQNWLQEHLQHMENLQKENAELERVSGELRQVWLKIKEVEQACRHLAARIEMLEAQVILLLLFNCSPWSCHVDLSPLYFNSMDQNGKDFFTSCSTSQIQNI